MKKILFLMQLPPPVHGASVVNKSIHDSSLVNSTFLTKFVNISPAINVDELGKFSIRKLFISFFILIKSIFYYVYFSPNLVYMTLSPHGIAFWKDSIILIVIKVLRGKCIVHLHGKGIADEVSSSKIKKIFYKFVFKRVDVIHLSESLSKDTEAIRDNKASVYILNNGVHSPCFDFTSKSGVLRFLYLSNYIPEKGADTLVKAINLIEDKYINSFTVDFYGKQVDEKFFQELNRNLENKFRDSINFFGPIYSEDKFTAFSNRHVFVLPTYYKNESFPLSILEAMSFGLPILSTFEGSIPEIVVDGETGFIFPANDPVKLSHLMVFYIQNPDILFKHRVNSYERFKKKYTLEQFETELCNILVSAC